MSRVPSETRRQPLNDTSKNFVNVPKSAQNVLERAYFTKKQALLPPPTTATPNHHQLDSYHKPQKRPQFEAPTLYDEHHRSESIIHAQKLTTSDRLPQLQGASTPKKDGYLPFLHGFSTHTSNASTNQVNNQQANPTITGSTAVNVTTKKMTGNELSKWQQTWREILPRSHIYFEQDHMIDADKKRAIHGLKSLGASIDPFFSENVTIIVSRRPFEKSGQYPPNDLFRIAVKKQLKVWSIDKVFRFLTHLGVSIPDSEQCKSDAPNKTYRANTNLGNLLMNERIFGPSDRDPSVKRNDFKYFTNYYLYIYDVTQRTRPVAIREWKDKSYPRIHKTTNGKTFFLSESKSVSALSLLKRHHRRLQCLKDTEQYRQDIINHAYKNDSSFKTYAERVAFKIKWENKYYESHSEENPYEKYKKLYESLDPQDKHQFRDLFDDISSIIFEEDDDSVEDGFMISNKRQKLKNVGDQTKYKFSNESELDEIYRAMGINETKQINSSNENDNQKGNENENDNAEALVDNLIQENKEYDERLNNLISDKSDDIDKFNNPLANEATKVVQSIELPKKRKMPQLERTESHIPTTITTKQDREIIGEYGEIEASGIQASGINPSGTCSNGNNGLGPSKSQVVNKFLVNERKKIFVLTPTPLNKYKARNSGKNSDKENIAQQNNKVLIADGSIPEPEDQILIEGKMNDDELSALRSVEAANLNPFFSDCKGNQNGNKTGYNDQILKKGGYHKNNEKREIMIVPATKEAKPERAKHEMKPGYCENCRIKYNDFQEHVNSDKHRSFATNDSNFKQIDELIKLFTKS